MNASFPIWSLHAARTAMIAATVASGAPHAASTPTASEGPRLGTMSLAERVAWVVEMDRARIVKLAEAALATRVVSLRAAVPPKTAEGVEPGDFYSMGDYWWPDPARPNGLPYVQRDGESNPDNFDAHRLLLREMKDAVAALAAGYVVTRNDAYAAKATELLRCFFVEPDKRMNPHLRYAQAIPGITPGRGIGIIDTLHLVEVPLAVNAIERSPEVDAAVAAGVRRWFDEYLQWLRTHPNGREESKATNNHSVAYFLQTAVFARFTHNAEALAEARRFFVETLLPQQMAADGSFPRELGRTKPYGYSIFQLDNVVLLAHVLSERDDELMLFSLPDGRGVQKAVAFLVPYLTDRAAWPHRADVQYFTEWPVRQPALLLSAFAFGEAAYLDLWKRLNPDPTNLEVRRNMAVTQPLLWILPAAHAIAAPN